MCSAPSSLMISVPLAGLLPSQERPVRRSNSFITSGGNPWGYSGKRLGEVNARHLPMTGGRILAGGREGAAAVGGAGAFGRRDTGKRPDVAQPQPGQVGQLQAPQTRDVAERVAARVAVLGGIGHLADSYTIEYDPDDPSKHKFDCNMRHASYPSLVSSGGPQLLYCRTRDSMASSSLPASLHLPWEESSR